MHGKQFGWFRLVLAISSALSAARAHGAELPTLDFVRDAHQAAVASIQSLQCDIQVSGPKWTESAHYVRSGDLVHIAGVKRKGGVKSEVLVKDGLVRSVGIVVDPKLNIFSGGTIQTNNGVEFTQCDVWSRALLTVDDPNSDRALPFAELLREASRVESPHTVVVDGRELVAVGAVLDKPGLAALIWRAKIFFDPAKNWLIVRTEHATDMRGGRRITRIRHLRDLKEAKPGIFFPGATDALLSKDDAAPGVTFTSKFTNVRINEPVSASVFTIHYPEGLPVNDYVQNAQYTVNSRGERISEPRYLLVETPRPRGPVSVRGEPTKEEPGTNTRWYLIVGGAVLVSIALLHGWRMNRRRRAGE